MSINSVIERSGGWSLPRSPVDSLRNDCRPLKCPATNSSWWPTLKQHRFLVQGVPFSLPFPILERLQRSITCDAAGIGKREFQRRLKFTEDCIKAVCAGLLAATDRGSLVLYRSLKKDRQWIGHFY